MPPLGTRGIELRLMVTHEEIETSFAHRIGCHRQPESQVIRPPGFFKSGHVENIAVAFRGKTVVNALKIATSVNPAYADIKLLEIYRIAGAHAERACQFLLVGALQAANTDLVDPVIGSKRRHCARRLHASMRGKTRRWQGQFMQ